MRTIKFRGKKPSNDVWMYGSLVLSDELDTAIYFQVGTAGVKQMEWVYVKPETVGQFTGLKDKNGREIYEGDILECVSWNEFWSIDGKPLEQLRRRLLVGHRHGAFVCIERQQAPFDDKVWDIISNQDCIIIGNIYDNPELWPKRQPFECNF